MNQLTFMLLNIYYFTIFKIDLQRIRINIRKFRPESKRIIPIVVTIFITIIPKDFNNFTFRFTYQHFTVYNIIRIFVTVIFIT